MDITAMAGVAAQPGVPRDAARVREALGQEFGRLFFQTLLQGAAAPGASGKGRAAMQALPLDLASGEFARQLAVQHEQMFGQLLFNEAAGGQQR